MAPCQVKAILAGRTFFNRADKTLVMAETAMLERAAATVNPPIRENRRCAIRI
jgi:hypothetical protein